MSESIYTFRRFLLDSPDDKLSTCHLAALDKLQTLFPGRRITTYDLITFGIETDSYYSATGIDTYELGLIDDEIPALRNTRDGEIITFRI